MARRNPVESSFAKKLPSRIPSRLFQVSRQFSDRHGSKVKGKSQPVRKFGHEPRIVIRRLSAQTMVEMQNCKPQIPSRPMLRVIDDPAWLLAYRKNSLISCRSRPTFRR